MSWDALWRTWWNWNLKFVWALFSVDAASSAVCFLLMTMEFLSPSMTICSAAKVAVGRVRTQTLMVLFGMAPAARRTRGGAQATRVRPCGGGGPAHEQAALSSNNSSRDIFTVRRYCDAEH